MARERNPKHSSERSESHKSNPVQGQNEPKYGKSPEQGRESDRSMNREKAGHKAHSGKCDDKSCNDKSCSGKSCS
ncbi:MAG: hypothetical protein P4L31_03490 [Candidatus Babeliales bacterium]|nr:hypothetical protein [Candidatus Babeliales bacterium]